MIGVEIGEERAVALIASLQAGRLTRRQFVRRMAAAGFAGGTIALLLAACGGSSTNSQQSPAAGASNNGEQRIIQETGRVDTAWLDK